MKIETVKTFLGVLFDKKKRPPVSDKVYLKAKTVAFIVCSVVSAFINFVFIANLTKSDYGVGEKFKIPAIVLLGILSIALDVSKCLHAIQINTLKNLQREMDKFKWDSDKIKKLTKKWFTVYILYVLLSIITSVSLSSISIGSGITRNSNTLKQIDEFILQGEQYSVIDTAAKNINKQNLISQATDTTEEDANKYAQEQINIIRPVVEAYKEDRDKFDALGISADSKTSMEFNGETIIPDTYWTKRNKEVNTLLSNAGYKTLNGTQLKNLNLSTVQATIRQNYLDNHASKKAEAAAEKLNELTDTTMDEAYGWIETLNTVGLVNPKTGETVVFDTDPSKQTKVLISSALTRLKALRVDVENDSGDIGSSSKIFMQLGSAIESKKNKEQANSNDLKDALDTKSDNSFGATEVMMMSMLLFLSLLCELAINQFSGKTIITRKMLEEYHQYLPEDFDVNRFMLSVISDQCDFGEITEEEYEEKRKVALKRMLDKVKDQYDVGLINKEEFQDKCQNILERMFMDSNKIIEDYRKTLEAPKVVEVKPQPKKPRKPREPKKVEEPKAEVPVEQPKEEVKVEEPKVEAPVEVPKPEPVEQPKPKPSILKKMEAIRAAEAAKPAEDFNFDEIEKEVKPVAQKPVAKPKVVNQPVKPVQEPVNKMIVKSAERELSEMIGGK